MRRCLRNWARAIDEGPFSSLCWGERIAFENPDNLTLLGALAAWTDRVRLLTTVIVPQLHDPVMLAKALATGDMLCWRAADRGHRRGRQARGLPRRGRRPGDTDDARHGRTRGGDETGVGRRKDHRVGAAGRAGAGPARRSAAVRRAASGRRPSAAPRPGPTGWPAPRWTSTSPSKTSCSTWRGTAWAQAGKPKPHLVTSFWFAFGSPEQARAQVHRHLRRYMNWIPAEYVDAMAPMTGWAGSEDELLAVLRKFEGIGTDEVQLIPTSSDLEQLRRAADVAGQL